MKNNKFITKINSNKLLSVMAISISLGTFILLFYEINLTRKQQYISVLPYLSISQSMPESGSYRLYVTNTGIGPAFIEGIYFKYGDKEFKGDAHNLYMEFYKNNSDIDSIYSGGFQKGNMIPSRSHIDLIGTKSNENTVQKIKDLFRSKNMIIEITYSSVYGEKWSLNSRNGVKKID